MHTFTHEFFTLTVDGVANGAIYALVALGYTLVYGVLQLINFAHAEVFMWGSFGAAWVFVAFEKPGSIASLGHVLPVLLLAAIGGMVVSAIAAYAVERLAYRPLLKKNTPKIVILISAIGADFVLAELMGLRDSWGPFLRLPHSFDKYLGITTGGARNVYPMPVTITAHNVFRLGDYHVTDIDLVTILSAIAMMFGLEFFVNRTKLGRGVRAVAQDPEAAALMGVNPNRVIQVTFLLGGLMAGFAGTIYLLRLGSTTPTAGFIMGVKAFTAAVMGGIGNLRGALVGGLALGVLENWGSAFVGAEWRDVIAFSLLIVVLLVRPTGLLGEKLGQVRA